MLRELSLLTAKPVMFVANVGEDDGYEDHPRLEAVHAAAAAEGARVLPICAAIESELAGLDPEDQGEFLADLGLEAPGLDRFVRAGYELLDLRTFFSADPKEARAWTVRAGATAPEGAGRIHTDFERGFIRAEVVICDDFLTHGGEAGREGSGAVAPRGARLRHRRRRRHPLPLQRLTRPPQQHEPLRVGVRTRREPRPPSAAHPGS